MSAKLRSIRNLRDLGGIIAADGRKIKSGLLYRSGHHARLKPSDADALHNELGIERVADLRSPSETTERPDVRVEGIDYFKFPPLNDKQNPSINRRNRKSVLFNIMAREGGAIAHLSEIYKIMVISPAALDAYRRLVRLLLEPEQGPLLWHCTQGKDRAGIGTVAVLLALGVSREEIERDYMRTNRAYLFKNWLIYLGVVLVSFRIHAANSLHRLLTARREYLASAFEALDATFGGTDGFLRIGLGLSDSDILRLREIYLE